MESTPLLRLHAASEAIPSATKSRLMILFGMILVELAAIY